MCWPETRVNQTVFLPCPDYLNKFNKLGNNIDVKLKYKLIELSIELICL